MYCRIFSAEQTPLGLRVHGQHRRYIFHVDGRLKRRIEEFASDWVWYPGSDAYDRFIARNSEIDQMIPTEAKDG